MKKALVFGTDIRLVRQLKSYGVWVRCINSSSHEEADDFIFCNLKESRSLRIAFENNINHEPNEPYNCPEELDCPWDEVHLVDINAEEKRNVLTECRKQNATGWPNHGVKRILINGVESNG